MVQVAVERIEILAWYSDFKCKIDAAAFLFTLYPTHADNSPDMKSLYRARIAKIKKILKAQGPAAALLGAGLGAVRSNDTEFPFRQDSNFYYLTGLLDQGLYLFVHSARPRALLLCEPESEHRKLWEGPRKNPARLAAALGAELKESANLKAEIRKLLNGVDRLYYQNTPGSLPRGIADEILNAPPAGTVRMPRLFASVDTLLEELRTIKSPEELRAIERASSISAQGLKSALTRMHAGAYEWQISAAIGNCFRDNHAHEAFSTIVASGARAATLHYVRGEGRLKDGELLLIDWGAEHELYGSDMTRVFPVSGKFTPAQKALYQVVLRAQKAAIATVREIGRAHV